MTELECAIVEKALEKDPENTDAKEKLKALEAK